MFLIVGLGNPGEKYTYTRHNIGFLIVDKIAEMTETSLRQSDAHSIFGKGAFKGHSFILQKPTTYMNLSGQAIRGLCSFYKIESSNIFVIHDDLHLKVGQLRIRESGSAAGHNGVSDTIRHLNTDKFIRVRCGIGNDFQPGRQADYVLSPFKKDEVDSINILIQQAANAVLSLMTDGVSKTMNFYNK